MIIFYGDLGLPVPDSSYYLVLFPDRVAVGLRIADCAVRSSLRDVLRTPLDIF